jgi:hypothetical protein
MAHGTLAPDRRRRRGWDVQINDDAPITADEEVTYHEAI